MKLISQSCLALWACLPLSPEVFEHCFHSREHHLLIWKDKLAGQAASTGYQFQLQTFSGSSVELCYKYCSVYSKGQHIANNNVYSMFSNYGNHRLLSLKT